MNMEGKDQNFAVPVKKRALGDGSLSTKSSITQCSESFSKLSKLERIKKFKSAGNRLDKEERILKFLKAMNIEQVHPSEINFMREITCRDKSGLTPTLSLGNNTLLKKRSKKLRLTCDFSDCINSV
ncbi:unnamed protein product [Moneuplotes crassus]|uniref:Uncharacterized protein n=1 Tax=Euplotes crassus TaxID=5936 RepID=A0AAD1UPS1_EUPCR|nr:unnamed protein product [Moneuplotes crassus]